MKKLIIAILGILALAGPVRSEYEPRHIGLPEYWVFITMLYDHGAEGDGYRWIVESLYECAGLPVSWHLMSDEELRRLADLEVFAAEYIEEMNAYGNQDLQYFACIAVQIFTETEAEDVPEHIKMEIQTSDWDGGVPTTFIDAHEDLEGNYWIRDYPELALRNPWWVIETDNWAEYVCEHTDWLTNPVDERWAAENQCYPCGDPLDTEPPEIVDHSWDSDPGSEDLLTDLTEFVDVIFEFLSSLSSGDEEPDESHVSPR
jgi:hypothetical protein